MKPSLYLASQSPRRKQLLEQWGVQPELLLPDADEDVESLEVVRGAEAPATYVQRVTALKLQASLDRLQRRGLPPAPVLCADTTVALGRRILGKPADAAEARAMLRDLAGRTHRVLTAVAVGVPGRRAGAHLVMALEQQLPQAVQLARPQPCSIVGERSALFLGRGLHYPIALEGALKLKEISYIHAEGYASGELKHGPIALIDNRVPVIVLAPRDALFDKTVSNMQEVMARHGKVVLISDAAGIAEAGAGCWKTLTLPEVAPQFAPILYSIPAQLLAYHTAIAKGTDVDQPRNLAKSVTVE